jgi:ubiquinone/menaquinone biosynthesis C-methylase UbiE
MKTILDVCCGSRMFYYDKENENTIYMDNREFEDILCDGRKLEIKPDIVADFRNIPFGDNTFKLVVFDPPHLVKVGEKSWLAKKYGRLNQDTWQDDLKKGFNECMRVLEKSGILSLSGMKNKSNLDKYLKFLIKIRSLEIRERKHIGYYFTKIRENGGLT